MPELSWAQPQKALGDSGGEMSSVILDSPSSPRGCFHLMPLEVLLQIFLPGEGEKQNADKLRDHKHNPGNSWPLQNQEHSHAHSQGFGA